MNGIASVTMALMLLSSVTVEGAPRRLSKRSDDVLPDMAVVQELTSRVQTLEASLTALHNSLISTQANVDRLDTLVTFDVSFRDDVVSIGVRATAKFDDVILNYGNGYNAQTGIFSAPVTGTYAFYLKIQTPPGSRHALNLKHNGDYVGEVYGDDSDSYDLPSTQELVHATKGDNIWVETGLYADDFRGSGVTRFSGFLIHAD